MVNPIITQGYGSSCLIPTLGYGELVIAIPGFLKKRKPIQVFFDIDYLFKIYAQIRREFYEELDLLAYATLSFEYDKEFVIPINKEIEKQILINSSIKREIYQEINVEIPFHVRMNSWNTIFKILNNL